MSAPSTLTFGSPALVSVTKQGTSEAPIYVLTMLGAETPDNRLTVKFLTAYKEALDHVEKEWENRGDEQTGGAALVTTAVPSEKNKFFSNGLDFESAIGDPTFFDRCLFPVYESLLSFPMPTIASVGGHCFAAGMGLALAHDYRVMNGQKGFMCMNEIEFGAALPLGLYAALNSKIHSMTLMRKIVLEGHRFPATEAKEHGFVDVLSPVKGEDGGPAKTLETSVKLAEKLTSRAAKNCYGSNKLVINSPYIAILREKFESTLSRL